MLLTVVAVAVTGTVIVQDAGIAAAGAAPRLPPVSVTELAVLVSTPPQVVDGTADTLMPAAAHESVNVIGDSVVWL